MGAPVRVGFVSVPEREEGSQKGAVPERLVRLCRWERQGGGGCISRLGNKKRKPETTCAQGSVEADLNKNNLRG